jgi:predicted permease
MRTLLLDLRYSLRQLFQNPGFSLAALISLALGIGGATGVFSVLYSGLLHPYPYRAAENLVQVILRNPQGSSSGLAVNGQRQIRALEQLPATEAVLATAYHSMNLTGHEVLESVSVHGISGNTFSDLGVPPFMGRGILPSDATEGHDSPSVVVISYDFWRRHYLSAPDILERTIELDHTAHQIVGVAAPRFRWDDADVYLPILMTENPGAQSLLYLRLKPGSNRDAVAAQLQPLIEGFAAENPKQFPESFKVGIVDLNSFSFRRVGGTLYLMFGAVMLLLIIGCANVSILLLARGTARQYELAVRSAIGASRGRIVRQLLTESMLLATTGAALGIFASYAIVSGIRYLLPFGFPPEAVIGINRPVLLFATLLVVGTGVLFGLWPALRLSRTQVAGTGNTRMTAGVATRRTHDLLVAAQIAMTLLLLAASGSAMRSFITMLHRPLGYDPRNVMSVAIPLHDSRYKTWEARSTYFEQLREKVSEIPGVTQAAISIFSNPPRSGFDQRFEISGRSSGKPATALLQIVSPEFFPALRIPLLQGRFWNSDENHRAARFAVINRTLAQRYFPNGDALGRSLELLPMADPDPDILGALGTSSSTVTIIGIVDDVLNDNLRNPVQPAIYVPSTFLVPDGMQILVRANVPPLTLLAAVRSQIAKVDPELQIAGKTQELSLWISNGPEWQQERLAACVFPFFGMMAITLAAVGLYSVMAYTVAQRMNEFGIRMALGALPSNLLRLVLGSASRTVSVGIVTGVALTFALSRVLAHYADGSTHDAPLLTLVALAMILVALGASLIPARQASRIDPMVALRHE